MNKMKGLRQQFADTLFDLGKQDDNLVIMVGDISHGILQPFAKANPDRYYNIGICEPTIVNMAAGLNKVGMTPVLHTIAPFLIERSYEQIKLDFGYQNLSLNLVSVGGSFDYSQLGCSHHSYADVSLMSHLKRANIIIPGSALEFDILFREIYANDEINYFRLPENLHEHEIAIDDIHFGKAINIREGRDITLVTMGAHLKTAIAAANSLEKLNISTEILYFHTIKPFDYDSLRESASKTRCILSMEELSAHDGIFNQVLKSCMGLNDMLYHQIAVNDFIKGYGSFDYLCRKVGLAYDQVFIAAKKLFAQKNAI